MSTIKKGFVEIHNILKENEEAKVKELMPLLLELMESKQRDKNHEYRDGVLWVYCYYHKEWECTEEIEYGSKANTQTGLNTMCKIGVNCWTRQQRLFKEAKANLLNRVMEGELDVADLKAETEKLEADRDAIESIEEYHDRKATEAAEKEEAKRLKEEAKAKK